MDYEDILNQLDIEAGERLLASKILDLMNQLRLSNKKDQKAAKRWIW